MNPPGARTGAASEALFGDSLACTEHRPLQFLPGAIDTGLSHGHLQRAEALLRALAVVEDGRVEEPEEHTPADLALHRIEAKLDLLTTLVAALAKRDRDDPVQPLRWSAQGACVPFTTAVEAGSTGHLRVQPADWLPEPMLLPGTVLACEPGTDSPYALWLRFGPLSPPLEQALERHLFRVHRREIAERRAERAR